ncbi:hypothetical protein Patl1_37630 [Pistacia atlantica]|nr:hypothetical protein Patl1_37630 [Pistacia atlantica]
MYIELVKKHGLEISQPGLEPNNGLTWQMTKWRGDREVHKFTEEKLVIVMIHMCLHVLRMFFLSHP